jgi:exopolysaccharide biosynthesis WecB/TagA/CpsF family protein
MDRVQLLNASIHKLTFEQLLEQFSSGLIVFLNVDTMMKMQKDSEYAEVCREAEFVIADGQFLLYSARFLGAALPGKVSGSDFLGAFCERHRADETVKVFLLGAGPGVADKAMNRINDRVGRAVVIGAISPSYGFEHKPDECADIVAQINASGATVLAVGVGAPKQEKWIAKHRSQMPKVTRYLAVGATIDFEAGALRRAPRWMSDNGLEWFFRLSMEPRRLYRRYLIEGPPFFWLVLRQKLGYYQDPTRGHL